MAAPPARARAPLGTLLLLALAAACGCYAPRAATAEQDSTGAIYRTHESILVRPDAGEPPQNAAAPEPALPPPSPGTGEDVTAEELLTLGDQEAFGGSAEPSVANTGVEGSIESEAVANATLLRGNFDSCLQYVHRVRNAMVSGGMIGAEIAARATWDLEGLEADPINTPYVYCGLLSSSQWTGTTLFAHPFLPTPFTFAQVFQDSQDQWYDWYGAGTTFNRWIRSTIAFDLSDGAVVPEYAFFSPLLGFSPNATLRTYFLLVLNDISHRLEGESLAPILCGCGPL